MFSSDKWFGAEASFYNGVATQSLRFDDGSASELSRTFVTPTNQNRWTLNVWVKLTTLGARRVIIGMPYLDSEECFLGFDSNDQLEWQHYSSGGVTEINDLTTTAVFRDTSSWYNIHAIFDSAGSGDDRQQLWVNGVKITSYGTESRSSNSSVWNKAKLHYFGNRNDISSNYFDGYMSEINFVDGLALDPSYFGEFKNQIWIAKNPVVSSYGNNGFRLQFKNTGTGTTSEGTTATTNIGDDSSGNGHNFAVSGLSAHDCVPDSPENNFATMNPINKSTSMPYFSEGNLKLAPNAGNYNMAFSNMGVSSGKFYYEFGITGTTNSGDTFGVIDSDGIDYSNNNTTNVSNKGYAYYPNTGNKQASGVNASYGATYTNGDVIGVALDMDAGKVWFAKNGTYQASGNPASGTNEAFSGLSGTYFAGATLYAGGFSAVIHNFGQDSSFSGNKTAQGNTDANGIGDFYYAPPSGFLALCSANLPEPTISPNKATQADDHFNTVLYSGNQSGGHAITGVGFQPDWVWIKSRSETKDHVIQDSSRGVDKRLSSNSTSAERTDSPDDFDSFDSDGFTLGANTETNKSSQTYVAWNWKANGGTTSSNTDGSITSTVQANTTAGFSIVLYTGTGASNATIGHGLGAVPKQIWVKNRDAAYNWKVYHAENTSAPETDYLVLDTTDATVDSNTHWNDTAPTSTVFSIGSSNALIRSGDNFVAYCFAEVEGYSKFGSYTGNGNADGVFVFTGFRPAWIMTKETSATSSWNIYDNARSDDNPATELLIANSTNSEGTGTDIDIVSNGFKVRSTSGNINTSGNNYIYMAFAEAPFKYANAR